jgi:hypothetical protein
MILMTGKQASNDDYRALLQTNGMNDAANATLASLQNHHDTAISGDENKHPAAAGAALNSARKALKDHRFRALTDEWRCALIARIEGQRPTCKQYLAGGKRPDIRSKGTARAS